MTSGTDSYKSTSRGDIDVAAASTFYEYQVNIEKQTDVPLVCLNTSGLIDNAFRI